MEKVVGADKGAEAPVIEPNKSGEVSAAKKEDFYTKMQNKMIDLRKQSNIYLNHAPKSEKYGLCQRIRNLEDEIFGLLIEARKRYWNKTSLTKLDVAHEQLRGYWRLFYELGYWRRYGSCVTARERTCGKSSFRRTKRQFFPEV